MDVFRNERIEMMAKRKRLTGPLGPGLGPDVSAPAPETAQLSPVKRRPPIADVAGEAAATSALTQMADQMEAARTGGRMVVELPLSDIAQGHLLRDRMVLDADEMDALKTSLQTRGQQTPIEVEVLEDGRYGLISGFRRLTALQELAEAGQGSRTVLALIRKPEDASTAYTAMVEENEIRVGLSFFERANIVAQSVDKGVFPHEKAALAGLFGSASRSKRSKIKSFLPVVRTVGSALKFPASLGERTGLALAAALSDDKSFAKKLVSTLKSASVTSPEDEGKLIQSVLSGQSVSGPAPVKKAASKPVQTIEYEVEADRMSFVGAAVDDALVSDMKAFFKKRGIELRQR